MISTFHITRLLALAAVLLAAGPVQAAITITNEPGHVSFGTGSSTGDNLIGGARSTYTITNFALNGGNAVVLFFGAETSGGLTSTQLSATYGGQAMTVVQTAGTSNQQSSIAYIINPSVSTGNIVASWVNSSESIIEAIALSNVGSVVASISRDSTTASSLSLNYTTALDGGFVVGSGNNNSFNGGAAAAPSNTGSNLDSLLFEGNVSANFATVFAYGDAFNAGTYTDTIGSSPTALSAALVAFEAVPEPSAALLGGLGFLLLLRRRR